MLPGRLGVLATTLVMLGSVLTVGPSAVADASGRRLPAYLSLDPQVTQLITVTSPRWSDTRARLRMWRSRWAMRTAGRTC